jgi:predicted transglutaminase-like cysteine proteinase
MAIYLTKRLSVFANILALVLFLPGIAFAAPVEINTTSGIIFAQTTKTASYSTSSEINLTPLQRQELQAVRQRRNREIEAVLTSSQRIQLTHNLRAGNNIKQALEKLKLQPEQQDLVKAIVQFTNLKMKAISSRHLLKTGKN